jgi:SAM-dependent methyltransferase
VSSSEQIAAFPEWHYDFEIDGQRTNPAKRAWQEARAAQIIGPAVELSGGSLAGTRVLDLGCNAGFFSLKAIEAGCEFVLGIDGRQVHVDQSNLVFDSYGVDRGRYDFVCGNFLEYPFEQLPPFDLVLCLGVLYHVANPIGLLGKLAAVNSDLLVIDTKLSRENGTFLELRRETLGHLLNAVDYELVTVPTAKAVTAMAEQLGYTVALPTPDVDAPDMGKYRWGAFATFLCAKSSNVSTLDQISMSKLRRMQEEGLVRAEAKRAGPPPRGGWLRRLFGR